MPRLTYQPSGMSRASRSAICTRDSGLHGGNVLTFSFTSAFTASSPSHRPKSPSQVTVLRHRRLAIRHVQHAVDVNSRRGDFFRIERAKFDDVLSLHDGQLGGCRHHRIEIARGRLVGEVAPAVSLPGLDQRHVAVQRFFQQIFAAANFPLFLAFGELGADGGRRIESRYAGTRGAHALRHGTLRHDFKLDTALAPELLKHHRIGRARKRAHDLSHVAGFQELGQTQMADAGIVGNDRQILGALLDETVDQDVRLANAAEAADEHDRAVGNTRHRFGHGFYDFVDHESFVVRHPEVRAERASKDTARAPPTAALRGSALRAEHLRVTDNKLSYPTTRIFRSPAKAGITSRAKRAKLSCASPPPPPLSRTYSTPRPRSFSSLRAISSGVPYSALSSLASRVSE